MKKIGGALIVVLVLVGTISADECKCGKDMAPVGPSFRVHGRLACYNGNPPYRIWIIGTHRILGVHETTELPKNVDSLVTDFEDELFGDFDLCPLSKSEPGVMQIVCVQSAAHLIKKTRK